MKQIAELTLPGGIEISLLYNNGRLGYTFVHKEQTYGNSVRLPSRSVNDIAATALILFSNALETKQHLHENK